jgi:galactose oxidase
VRWDIRRPFEDLCSLATPRDAWREQFAKVANGSYIMRGIEMTFTATVTEHLGKLALAGSATRPGLELAPLQAVDAVQWDIKTRSNKPMSDDEASAFARLSAALAANPAAATVKVTGPLKKDGAYFSLRFENSRLIGLSATTAQTSP